MKHQPIVPLTIDSFESEKEEVGVGEPFPHTSIGVPVDPIFFEVFSVSVVQAKQSKAPKFEDFRMEIQKMGDCFEEEDDDVCTEISTDYRSRNSSHKKLVSKCNELQVASHEPPRLKLNRCHSSEFSKCDDESEKKLPEIVEEDDDLEINAIEQMEKEWHGDWKGAECDEDF